MKSISFIALLCLITGAVSAHHSTRGIYKDEEVAITGTVKEWRFINPHPYLTMDVEAPDGSINEWDVSYGGAAVVHLKRLGYTAETFKPGDVVVVTGNPARAEGVFGILVEGGSQPTWEDGTPVVKGGSMF